MHAQNRGAASLSSTPTDMAWNSDDSGIAKNSLGNYYTIDNTKGYLDG